MGVPVGYEETSLQAADGCPLHWQAWWPAGEAAGAVVLVHGLGEHAGRYTRVREALTGAGYLLCGCDLRGHGRSGGRRGALARWADFGTDLSLALERARQLVPGRPLYLYAHSLGSLIALDLIRRDGAGLAGAVLSAAPLDASRVAPAWQAALLRALARVWPGFTMKVALPGRLLSRDPEVARAYEADPLVHWSRSASLALEGLLAVERVRASTGPLRTPALFLHGEEDPIAPVAAVRAFVSALPPGDHTLRVYPGGLHEPHNDLDHATVLADVVRWLGKRG